LLIILRRGAIWFRGQAPGSRVAARGCLRRDQLIPLRWTAK